MLKGMLCRSLHKIENKYVLQLKLYQEPLGSQKLISSISSLQADSRNNLLSVNNVAHKSQSKLRLFCCCYDFLDSTIKLQRKELLEFF